MNHILILGSSAAGISTAKTLRENGFEGAVTLVSPDREYYSRCQLHMVAAGNRTEEQARLLPVGWDTRWKLEFLRGRRAASLQADARTVTLDDGSVLSYDKLMIATGARTFWPPVQGLEGPNALGLRHLEDAVALRETLRTAKQYVVIGAGLVGVELALELAHLGKRVALVEMAPIPLPLQLEAETGALCASILKRAGVHLVCGDLAASVTRDANGFPRSVELKSGLSLPAEVIVNAAGVRANAEFAAQAGIKTDRGIIIDEYCRTSVPDVYAAGDVAQTLDSIIQQVIPSAIWPTAVRQGKIAALSMLGKPGQLERNTGFKAAVVLDGIPVISLGPVSRADHHPWEKKVFRSTSAAGRRSVKIFYLHEDRLKAALLWGDITNAGLYFESIINQRPVNVDMPWLDRLDAAKRGPEQLHVL